MMPDILLTPAMEKDIEDAIASGEYTSASEIVREGMRLWKERRLRSQLYDEWLTAQIELGWDQAERGDVEEHDMQTIIDEVLAGENTGK
jgi:antitoxin ParD1/3/4